MKRVAVLVALAVALAVPAVTGASNLQPWMGFRTARDRAYCFMEIQRSTSAWTGVVCFRPRDGTFAALRGAMAAPKARIRVQRGFGGAFRGYRDRRVRVFRAGSTWSTSDAEIVVCRIRVASVTCRHWRGASFTLAF